MRISDWSSDVCSSDLIELIQQRNDVPSIYLDDLTKYGEVLHHTSSWTTSYDDDVKRILDAGHTPVQEARIGGNRLAYFECGPGYPSTTMEIYDVSGRSEEHTSELQSLMRISYVVFC